jgi:NAD(P)-dependent dehydrogenase (short-subunit alcohol dehydrogenase family)
MKPEDFDIIGLECDVASEHAVRKTYQQVMDNFGRVDSVVACAGTMAVIIHTLHLMSIISYLARHCGELPRH